MILPLQSDCLHACWKEHAREVTAMYQEAPWHHAVCLSAEMASVQNPRTS